MSSVWNIIAGVGQVLAGAFLLATGAGAALGARLLLSGGLTLLASFLPRKSGGDGWKSSPRYGFDNLSNVTNEGGVKPVIYGREKVAPPIISANLVAEGDEQVLYVQCLLGEGEIDSVHTIELNEVPLSSFPGSWRIVKRGTPTQTAEWKKGGDDEGNGGTETVRGFDQVARPYQAGTRLDEGASHVYVMKDSANALALNFVWPGGMYRIDDDGGTESANVGLKIERKRNGDPDNTYVAVGPPSGGQGAWYADGHFWKTRADTQSALRRQIRLDFPEAGAYTVRVTGTINDDAGKIRVPTLSSVIELSDDARAYANSALLALRIAAGEQLAGGIPRITCVVKGRKLLDPRTGVTAWTQNPVLVARDILTNTRYGAGFDSSDVDDGVGGTFRTAADAADASVTSRARSAEPRFHCDLVVDQRSTHRDWLTQVLGSCRMSLRDSEGLWKIVYDSSAVGDVTAFEARADVAPLAYGGARHNVLRRPNGLSSLEVREIGMAEAFNVLRCRFTDETDRWRQRVLEIVNRTIAVGTFTGTPTAGESFAGATSGGSGRFVYTSAGTMRFVQDEASPALVSGEVLTFADSGATVTTAGAPATRPTIEKVHEIQLYGVTRPTQVMRELRYFLNVVEITPTTAAWGFTAAEVQLEPGDDVTLSDDVMEYAAKAFRMLDGGRDMLGAMRGTFREFSTAVYADTIDEIPAVPADGSVDPATIGTANPDGSLFDPAIDADPVFGGAPAAPVTSPPATTPAPPPPAAPPPASGTSSPTAAKDVKVTNGPFKMGAYFASVFKTGRK